MDQDRKQGLGFTAFAGGLLAIFMAGYAWIEGHDWPRITESWTAILAGVGLGVSLLGLLLTWPRS